MARINVVLPDDVDNKFRKEIAKRFGVRKGNIEKAMIEAIEIWIKNKG